MRKALLSLLLILLALAAIGWLVAQGVPPRKTPIPLSVSVAVAPPPAPVEQEPEQIIPPAEYEAAIGPPLPPLQPLKHATGKAEVALVIDDCGISTPQTMPVLALPPEVTLSFLPYGNATRSMAYQAAGRGHDVFLHMPMQPVGHDNPGPDALTVGLDGDIVRARVTAALERVPGAIGMNNHMGSAATADAPLMQAIMPMVAEHHLMFLDSYTSAKSLAYQTAQTAGVSSARRDIFLDDTITPEAIAIQLQQLEKRAKKQGHAIAIGHPHPVTMAALAQWIAEAPVKGITLVRVKDLMRSPLREGQKQ